MVYKRAEEYTSRTSSI